MTGEIDAALLASLPKVELHIHLEGAISAGTVEDLARRHGIAPPAPAPGRYPDFGEFVRRYLLISGLLRTPDDVATAAADVARHQAAQGIVYTEVTFTALTHVRNGLPPRDLWAALRDGLSEAGPAAEVHVIVDAVRDLGPAHAHDTIALVEEADAPIVGLGLAGTEGAAPETAFAALRDAADRLGLGLAVHAGETGTADNVRRALDELGADRIGHGIASVEDPRLVDRLARERTPLEVCPSSNVALGVVPELAQHPLRRLHEAGVNVTVHSDDPAFFATDLTAELGHAVDVLGLDVSGVAELQRRAARAAFAPAATRARLEDAIDRWAATAA